MFRLSIVSRKSPLALWQAHYVRRQLLTHYPEAEVRVIGIKTQADRELDTPLYKMGGKSIFIKELETALLRGEGDVAVHSLKDVPAELPDGLVLAAFCERENPFDAWVCPKGDSVRHLAPGSRVGTSSLRRIMQLKKLNPDIVCIPLRGNVDSRIAKCERGEWDALVLAAAGLTRLNLSHHIHSIFTKAELTPAVGQGVLGLECRKEDHRTHAILSVLDHAPTRLCVRAERAMNASLGGTCQTAIGGFAEIRLGKLVLMARVGEVATGVLLEVTKEGACAAPEALGEAVAEALKSQGALAIIARGVDRLSGT